MFAVTIASYVAAALLAAPIEDHPRLEHATHFDIGLAAAGVGTAALGMVLSRLRPRNAIGWLLALSGLMLGLCGAGQNYGSYALAFPDRGLPFGEAALSWSAPLWTATVLIPSSVLLVRYPSGTISGRWPRLFDRAVIVGWLLVYVSYAGSLNSVTDEVADARPPLVLPDPVSAVLAVVGGVLLLGGTALIIGDAARRCLRNADHERAPLLLLLVTATTAGLVTFAGGKGVLDAVAYPLMLVAIAVGVLRYRALGIEVVVRRALLYAALTGLVLLTFIGITTVLAQLLPTGPTPQIIAAVLIAVGLSPARERIQGLVDRLLYGERDDPAATLKRLGSSMGSAPSEGLLLAVLANLAEALRLDGAEIVSPDGEVVARWGSPTGQAGIPLTFAGEGLGVLRAGSRRGEPTLGRADRQLLDTVVPLIAAVVHTARLSDELRGQRNRVLEATEAERRRLRQELHDGLGPSLTGVGLGLEAAQSGPFAGDPELLARLRTEVASSLEEIRRIIEDLRPVSLDGADLVTALERRVSAASAAGVVVRLVVDGPLPPLPPEVETAAFRIADEALNNVVRHAGARHCTVTLSAGSSLRLVVADDGVGLDSARAAGDASGDRAGGAEWRGGVGLGSMRERAERLGGSFALESCHPGTAVVAELPLAGLQEPQSPAPTPAEETSR
jgi:signal transduction histidine kinase